MVIVNSREIGSMTCGVRNSHGVHVVSVCDQDSGMIIQGRCPKHHRFGRRLGE